MPLSPDMQEIIAPLLKATREGRVNWAATGRNAVGVSLQDASIEMWEYGYNETIDQQEDGYSIAIVNAEGQRIAVDSVHRTEPAFSLMDELFQLATRKSKNIDKIIKGVLASLEKPGPVGVPPKKPSMDDVEVPF